MAATRATPPQESASSRKGLSRKVEERLFSSPDGDFSGREVSAPRSPSRCGKSRESRCGDEVHHQTLTRQNTNGVLRRLLVNTSEIQNSNAESMESEHLRAAPSDGRVREGTTSTVGLDPCSHTPRHVLFLLESISQSVPAAAMISDQDSYSRNFTSAKRAAPNSSKTRSKAKSARSSTAAIPAHLTVLSISSTSSDSDSDPYCSSKPAKLPTPNSHSATSCSNTAQTLNDINSAKLKSKHSSNASIDPNLERPLSNSKPAKSTPPNSHSATSYSSSAQLLKDINSANLKSKHSCGSNDSNLERPLSNSKQAKFPTRNSHSATNYSTSPRSLNDIHSANLKSKRSSNASLDSNLEGSLSASKPTKSSTPNSHSTTSYSNSARSLNDTNSANLESKHSSNATIDPILERPLSDSKPVNSAAPNSYVATSYSNSARYLSDQNLTKLQSKHSSSASIDSNLERPLSNSKPAKSSTPNSDSATGYSNSARPLNDTNSATLKQSNSPSALIDLNLERPFSNSKQVNSAAPNSHSAASYSTPWQSLNDINSAKLKQSNSPSALIDSNLERPLSNSKPAKSSTPNSHSTTSYSCSARTLSDSNPAKLKAKNSPSASIDSNLERRLSSIKPAKVTPKSHSASSDSWSALSGGVSKSAKRTSPASPLAGSEAKTARACIEIGRSSISLHFSSGSDSEEVEDIGVNVSKSGGQPRQSGDIWLDAAEATEAVKFSKPKRQASQRSLPPFAGSAETTAVSELSSRRVSRSTPSASSFSSPKAGQGRSIDDLVESSEEEAIIVLPEEPSAQGDAGLARDVQRLRKGSSNLKALRRLRAKLARRIKPVNVDVLRAVKGKEAFDILTRDEKIAWLTLNYIKLLYTNKKRAGHKDSRNPNVKDTTSWTVNNTVWKLGNMQSQQWMPQNIVGVGELLVPPGYRALSVGQLRAVGIHFSQTQRVGVGFDEDKMETATSVLLNDASVEDWGSVFVLQGEDPEPGELGEFPGVGLDNSLPATEIPCDTDESWARISLVDAFQDQVISLRSAQNMALYTAWKHEYPLRVVRGHLCCSRYAPEWGFRYDGLYRIVDVLLDSSDPPALPGSDKGEKNKRGRPPSREQAQIATSDWRLPGRCVFKFIFASIHNQHYKPPVSSWRTFQFEDMKQPCWKTRYRLQQLSAILHRQFSKHKRAQALLLERSQYPYPSSRLVEVLSDLPRPFGLLVPPVLTYRSVGTVLTSIGAVVASAFETYRRLRGKCEFELGNSRAESAILEACELYSAAWRGQTEGIPSWASAGFLPVVVEVISYELHLKTLPLSERQKVIEAHIAKGLPRQAGSQRWGGSGWEGGGGGRSQMIPNGGIRRKKSALSFTLEGLERQLGRLATKAKWLNRGHRSLEWVKTTRRLLISKQYALEFAHTVLPQSASCGIISRIRLGAPLPLDWNPWTDVSQGREVFKIPALNYVDDTPPPTDFAYQTRNILFSRLPRSSTLCLCRGCIPPGVDTSDWERVELPNYCDAVRHPITGRIYCAGAGQDFLKKYPLTLALCSAHCLCNAESCLNRLDEDLKFRVSVVRTRYAGWELRTLEAIPKDAYIMQYVGEMIPRALMDGRSKQMTRRGYHNYCMELVVEEKDVEFDWRVVCINSLFIGNASRFLNHSCDPNVRVSPIWRGPELPMIGIFADKDIPAGRALTYAYGSGYEEMLCLCGTPNCKGFLGVEG